MARWCIWEVFGLFSLHPQFKCKKRLSIGSYFHLQEILDSVLTVLFTKVIYMYNLLIKQKILLCLLVV